MWTLTSLLPVLTKHLASRALNWLLGFYFKMIFVLWKFTMDSFLKPQWKAVPLQPCVGYRELDKGNISELMHEGNHYFQNDKMGRRLHITSTYWEKMTAKFNFSLLKGVLKLRSNYNNNMLLEIANIKKWATIHSRCIFLSTFTANVT